MSIERGYKANFRTLLQAIENNDVCLMKCRDVTTGQKVVVICAVNHHENGDVSMAPIAKMFDGNPYEELLPPSLGDDESLTLEREAV
jgi:hypothetical protein